MNITFLTTTQIAKKLRKLIADYDEFYWAVAWGSNGPLADELISSKQKMRNILIGIQFCQTDPKLLERLAAAGAARIAVGICKGTFHPKAYYFQSGVKAAAIVGSANFTRAGTTENIEAAVLIEGSTNDEPLQKVRAMVVDLWKIGTPIDDEFLISYRLQYAANLKYRDALNKPLRVARPAEKAAHPDLLTMSWPDYVAEVKASKHHDLIGRLDMLRKAHALLNCVNSFSELGPDARKAIAGVVGRRQKLLDGLNEYDWGWFGSMFGAGSFKNRIAENDPHLSRAMDFIPPTGEIVRDDYLAFVEEFNRAFDNSKRAGRVPTASRLLAMKRPDYFVCVDERNRKGLSSDLGFFPTTLDFAKYWTEVVEPITQAKWWQVRRPPGTDGRIWDCRAAMLDAIYYEPMK